MPTLAAPDMSILTNQPISTWFNVGGQAKRMAKPATTEELRALLASDPTLRVLGDGANLLVADGGVDELVVSLTQGEFTQVQFDEAAGTVRAGAGAKLPQLLTDAARRGLAGIEGLAGIPASIGGAAVMNAGGTFATMADTVYRVHGLDRAGKDVTLEKKHLQFGYRSSNLKELIVTAVEFRLRKDDPGKVRSRLTEAMAYKKKTQPLADHSAGCVFKNPTLKQDLPGVGPPGARVSAGMLIDRAGCKGLARGNAIVSDQHANFFLAKPGCTAEDMIELMRAVREQVLAKFKITLEPEVVIWGASI